MDMVVDIFKQLGADASLVYQFVIIVVMFYFTKFLFLDHLQAVLDNREDKTINLEGSAEEQFIEIEKIQNNYKEQIQSATQDLKNSTESKKAEISKREETKYRTHEQKTNSLLEDARKKLESDIGEKKNIVMKEAQALATDLVDKVAKGL
jgi:F0F1-type ATP synthase membrane subunit b/b'